MKPELSFDLVMEEDMPFAEGSYRLNDGPWKVFIFSKSTEIDTVKIDGSFVWQSGAKGHIITLPISAQINKLTIANILSNILQVESFIEVNGPDSIELR